METLGFEGVDDGYPGEVDAAETSSVDDEGQEQSSSTRDNTKEVVVGSSEGNQARFGLFVFSALYTALYAGAFFGWGPMQLMLEENGAFSSKCDEPPGPGETCAKQTASLLNVQMVAQLTMIFAPLLGEVADRLGAPTLTTFLGISGCGGIGLLTLSAAEGIDTLLFFAFVCIGFMSVSTSIMIVKTGMVFRGRNQSRVISGLNTLFDAGSITYLGLRTLSKGTGASLAAISGGYLVVAAVCFGGARIFWTTIPAAHREVGQDTVEPSSFRDVTATGTRNFDDGSDAGSTTDSVAGVDQIAPVVVSDAHSSGHTKMGDGEAAQCEDERPEEDPPAPSNSDYVLIALRKPTDQLKSKQFLLLAFFYAYHASRNIFTLTTARDFLAYLGDNHTGNKYLTIFTLLMPASVFGLPLVDRAVGQYGYHVGLQTINCLGIVHGTIQVSSENLDVQVLGFVVFSFYRCFLFAVVFSFLPTFLGLNVTGKGAGVLNCVAGICTFINIPFANLAVDVLDGNFFVPNLFYTVFILPCVFVGWRIGQGVAKEKAINSCALFT